MKVHLDLDGFPVTLIDTAGVREAEDAIGATRMRRALKRAGHADLVLRLDERNRRGMPRAIAGHERRRSGASRRKLIVVRGELKRISGCRPKTGENMHVIEKLTAFARRCDGADRTC